MALWPPWRLDFIGSYSSRTTYSHIVEHMATANTGRYWSQHKPNEFCDPIQKRIRGRYRCCRWNRCLRTPKFPGGTPFFTSMTTTLDTPRHGWQPANVETLILSRRFSSVSFLSNGSKERACTCNSNTDDENIFYPCTVCSCGYNTAPYTVVPTRFSHPRLFKLRACRY